MCVCVRERERERDNVISWMLWCISTASPQHSVGDVTGFENSLI